MHEIMVSDEEANHCVERGDYYAILSMLPELQKEETREPMVLSKEYSSADKVLDFNETVALLQKHRLMIEDVELTYKGEILR
jgi:UDP-glucose 4-epimerase